MQMSKVGCRCWIGEWCHLTFARETCWPLICGTNFAAATKLYCVCLGAASWSLVHRAILLHPIHPPAWHDGNYLRYLHGVRCEVQFSSVNPMHQQKAGMMVHPLWKSLPS